MLKSEEIRWFALRDGTRRQRSVFRAGPGSGYGLFSPLDRARQDHTDRQTSNFLTSPELASREVLGIAGFQNGLNRAKSLAYALPLGPIGANPIYQSQSHLPSGERVRLSYGPHTGLEGNLEQVKKPLRVEIGGPPTGRATEAV